MGHRLSPQSSLLEMQLSVSAVNSCVINIGVCKSWPWSHHFLDTFPAVELPGQRLGLF